MALAVTLDHRFLLEVHSNEFVKLLACLVLVALVYCCGLRLLYFVTVLGGVSHCAPGTLRNYCGGEDHRRCGHDARTGFVFRRLMTTRLTSAVAPRCRRRSAS